MSDQQEEIKNVNINTEISRRHFLQIAGIIALEVGLISCNNSETAIEKFPELGNNGTGIPASQGYILVDTKKCQGCMICMLACSLVHEGKENLSLSRIQVIQNSFKKFPVDLEQGQCRQCLSPACIKACSTNALHADTKNGNARMVDKKKCIGCRSCIKACPYKPGRAVWNFEKNHAQTCDLCFDTPYWDEKGGVEGKQACVEVCPLSSIKFTKKIPLQKGDGGYKVNLRGKNWAKMGFSAD